jgi:hypothetical protein
MGWLDSPFLCFSRVLGDLDLFAPTVGNETERTAQETRAGILRGQEERTSRPVDALKYGAQAH